MRLFQRHLFILIGLACSVGAYANVLGPGSPAPALDIKTWYKGTPIKGFQKDQIYIVDFWSSSLDVKHRSFPILSDIARIHSDVTVIGVAIWEDDKGGKIKSYIDRMGDFMDYRVGYSGNKTGMAKTWMAAAEQKGIATSFIVKDNVIQWVGYTGMIKEPLAQIKAGTFNLKQHRMVFDLKAASQRKRDAMHTEILAIKKLIAAKKLGEAKTRTEAIAKSHPHESKSWVDAFELIFLARENPVEWEKLVQTIAAKKDVNEAYRLLAYAAFEAELGRNLKAGTQAANLALEATSEKDIGVMYSSIWYFKEIKDYKRTLALADKALKLLPSPKETNNDHAIASLHKLKAEMAEKIKKS